MNEVQAQEQDKRAMWTPHWRHSAPGADIGAPCPGDSHRPVSPRPSALLLLLPGFYGLE